MPTALHVRGISKSYKIYERPSDRLKEMLTGGRLKRSRDFWALRDIDFEITAGTTTGIIGPNGSGKSTLLQIIAGTLEPTGGEVFYSGRVSALLELGAGFNPEFTGVENVYMGASLMGFSRRETDALLPDIERFAEIGEFIHQPIKTYSSGMYVRLAFSLAIHVRPQLLILDEALAVGDAVFQHRCMRRIKELQQQGTTILFVSHDASAIRALCSRAILLSAGRLVFAGTPTDVLNRYQRIIMAREEAYSEAKAPDLAVESVSPDTEGVRRAKLGHSYRHGNQNAEIISVTLLNFNDQLVEIVESGEAVRVKVRALARNNLEAVVCGILIRNRHGIDVYGTNTELHRLDSGPLQRGEIIESTFSFDCWLAPGIYSLTVAAHSPSAQSFDWLDGVLFFRVVSQVLFDGIANLNSAVTTRVLPGQPPEEEAAYQDLPRSAEPFVDQVKEMAQD